MPTLLGEQSCATKNRMRELRSCGTVRDEGSNALVYSEVIAILELALVL
jgi:hypothetical protein